ncbi:hypothetical protein Pmani_032207 [Petrolisthes manimaculis]|uniref:Uncharacterized protein n=1 Tax=Petrolisthes manimaculis TaxID=1843537 RepID=A0AAE1NS92_9EUCA|nr:hypothetical protein Pmani_032207 [Petrolisthes manimaculis]
MWELGRTGVGGDDDGGEARLLMIQVITVSEGLWRRWIFQLVWDQPEVPVWGPLKTCCRCGCRVGTYRWSEWVDGSHEWWKGRERACCGGVGRVKTCGQERERGKKQNRVCGKEREENGRGVG